MSANLKGILVITSLLFGLSLAQDGPPQRKVTVPPIIAQGPSKTLVFRVEESFELVCVAKGEPDPSYYWHFNSEKFDPSGTDGRIFVQPGVGTLMFSKPIERDVGIYQCFAENDNGTAASVKVDIRLGILKPFPDLGVKTHYPRLGSALMLRCDPPVSVPQPKILWAMEPSGPNGDPVEYTDRISIDPEGNLNFAHIQAVDWADGRYYVCIVWNDVLRREQRGSYQKIHPIGEIAERHPPGKMWMSPIIQLGLRGETWRVKCIFSGNPTPRVTWTREGADMPPKMREESFGQELVLENAQYEDEGIYMCAGENSESPTPFRQSFYLYIEAAPLWTNEPTSTDAAEADTVIFQCDAEGVPKPKIDWYINGVIATKVKIPDRMKVEGNTITFSNLTLEDAMVFQCNASNKHGYIFTNAYLNVHITTLLGKSVGDP